MDRNYEYLSDEHANYIKNLIKKAGEKDKECEVFGTKVHEYQLDDTVSLEKVRKFEKQFQVELPEEYVFFITKVGNGGAGPYYGIDELDFDKDSASTEYYKNLSKPNMYDDNFLSFYNDYVTRLKDERRYEDDEEISEEKYDEFMEKLSYGVLSICNQGCTYDTLLVVNGSKKGEIIYIDWSFEDEPFFTNMSFLEWYQDYFEAILKGYNVSGYGYHMLENEDELIAKYANADVETKKKIISSFYKFFDLKKETIEFLFNFDGVNDTDRLELLLREDSLHGTQRAVQIFENFLEGDRKQIKVAVAVCIYVWNRDKYYDKILRFIYGDYGDFDDKLKQTALEFLASTRKFSAGDLLEFVKNKENSEYIRKFAMYIIERAEDKENFIDDFIDILNNIDSEQILLETIVALRNVESEKITQTYKALIPKYQNSAHPMIVKNMKYYLGDY